MAWAIFKYAITAAIVVLVSETAARYPRLGGLLAALPLVTVLTLIWLHLERRPEATVADHAWYTLWYVVPTLPMFAAFPFLLPRLGFWPTLGACVLITLACFKLFAVLLQRFGIQLL